MSFLGDDPFIPATQFWSPGRILAGSVAAIDLWVGYKEGHGFTRISGLVYPVIPLLLVWFPDSMAHLMWVAGTGRGRAPAAWPESVIWTLGWMALCWPLVRLSISG